MRHDDQGFAGDQAEGLRRMLSTSLPPLTLFVTPDPVESAVIVASQWAAILREEGRTLRLALPGQRLAAAQAFFAGAADKLLTPWPPQPDAEVTRLAVPPGLVEGLRWLEQNAIDGVQLVVVLRPVKQSLATVHGLLSRWPGVAPCLLYAPAASEARARLAHERMAASLACQPRWLGWLPFDTAIRSAWAASRTVSDGVSASARGLAAAMALWRATAGSL